jgi:hypothetical protein
VTLLGDYVDTIKKNKNCKVSNELGLEVNAETNLRLQGKVTT